MPTCLLDLEVFRSTSKYGHTGHDKASQRALSGLDEYLKPDVYDECIGYLLNKY